MGLSTFRHQNLKDYFFSYQHDENDLSNLNINKNVKSHSLISRFYFSKHYKNFKFDHNEFFENYKKENYISISHTDNRSAFISVPKNKYYNLLNIGIDLERADRKIPEHIKDKYINEEDLFFDETLLWVQKEAAFKCINSLYPDCFDLKQIIIKEDRFSIKNSTKVQGILNTFKLDDFIICCAGAVL